MELINNVGKTLRDDLMQQMQAGSRLSIAASCFSIYAFQELNPPKKRNICISADKFHEKVSGVMTLFLRP